MRALSIAATGMQAQQMNVEVIANNLANMNTAGYKRQRAEFQDLLYEYVSRAGTQTSSPGVAQWPQSIACACASTSQSSLSMPRETPVNKSAVSASPALLAVSIARRVLAPQFASALDNAATCFCPEARSNE